MTSCCPNIWVSWGPLPCYSERKHKRAQAHNSRPTVWGKDTHPSLVPCSQLAPPYTLFLTGPQASGTQKAWGRGIPGQTKSLGQGAACCRPTVAQCLDLPLAHSGLLFPGQPLLSPLLAPVQWETMVHGEADCLGSHTMSHPRSIRSRPKGIQS